MARPAMVQKVRDAFVAELSALAAEDPRVVVLSGDIGYGVFDDFRAKFPDRFINMGIAEQNMVGVAAGLALAGKRPVVYTIVPFATMRCLEQIRVDVCMQDLPVKIVGVGGGLAYGTLGHTHHSVEDVAVMRSLPNMRVYVPCDPDGTRSLTARMFRQPGPVYLRLGKNGEPDVNWFPKTGEVTIFGCGPILKNALEAAGILESAGISCRLVNVDIIKPLQTTIVQQLIRASKAVVTLEEHSVVGGLGSAVAEVIAEMGYGVPFKRIGIEDQFVTAVGSQKYLWEYCRLDAQSVVATIRGLIRK